MNAETAAKILGRRRLPKTLFVTPRIFGRQERGLFISTFRHTEKF